LRKCTFLVVITLIAMVLLAPGARAGPAHGATITGTSGDDDKVGTAQADTIDLLGGNDRASGLDKVDTIYGRNGSDILIGDGDNDKLQGNENSDHIAAAQSDKVDCGAGTDFVYKSASFSGTLTNCENQKVSTNLPSQPVSDVDGDGYPSDGAFADSCPNTAGVAPDGCPQVTDTTPPDTSISSGPADGSTDGSTINTDSASFTFSSTESGSTFECSLDSAAFSSCTSPQGYSGLANGSHTFSVRSTDIAGNTDQSPATRTFTVNVTTSTGNTNPSCAHWHHDAQRAVSGANTVAAYESEIQKAKAMGVNCFAYNLSLTDSKWNATFQGEIANLYQAAGNVGGFYLFPSADLCCGVSDSVLTSFMEFHYADGARLRVDGGRYGNNLPVASAWAGENRTPQQWTTLQNTWANQDHMPMFFIPHVSKGAFGGTAASLFDAFDGADINSQSDDVVDGLYTFGGLSGSPSQDVAENHEFDVEADKRPGMDAMFGCAPHFNRHSGSSSLDNRLEGAWKGFDRWDACLAGYVQDQPRFMELVTWNDYLEGSYLGGPYARSSLPATYDNNYFSHDAYRVVGKYYIDSYHNGSLLPISRDVIAISHRPHFKTPCSSTLTTNCVSLSASDRYGIPSEASLQEDKLYGVVQLTQPATVILHSGTTSQSFSVPAGVTELEMPFAYGTQSIELQRNGNQVLSATSSVQVAQVQPEYNFNVNTAYAVGP
jgi:Glycosyl hydrolase family 71